MAAGHPFVPDHLGEPGYRPRCRVCGQERHQAVPAPRTPADDTRVTAGHADDAQEETT